MRRALEEVDPRVETFSSAGYFGVAVDYKGIDDSHTAAFCPVVVKPEHAVHEQPKAEDRGLLESRRWRRRLLGLLMRNSLVSSKTLMRGWLSTTALGLLSAVPLVGHLLAPRRYALLRDREGTLWLRTQTTLSRLDTATGKATRDDAELPEATLAVPPGWAGRVDPATCWFPRWPAWPGAGTGAGSW